jgi:catechol 2,3-dioxygenase-like lactoylglutathione lyase family enzyme
MLENIDAIATVAVRNLDAARPFYERTLGLKPIDAEGEEVIVYRCGKSSLNVYRSEFAGTNKATAVTWNVGGAIDDIVASLRNKGVAFEHYDMPGLTRQGDLHICGGMKVAWFKDPDGNILNLHNGGSA